MPMEAEKAAAGAGRAPWSRKKKLLVGLGALAAVLAIALGLGLGLGLTRGRGASNDSGSGGSDSGSGPAPNRTSMWRPDVGAQWQIVLSKPLKLPDRAAVSPRVGIYDVDLSDNDADTLARLRGGGVRVICYFSAGSFEDWRPDRNDFADADKGKGLDGWRGERWLNVSSAGVRGVLEKRIQLAAAKGCDAIDPDNVDGYQNDNGLGLTQQDAADFVRFLAREAAAYNMSTGLKNAADIIDDVLDAVAFSVNEQCVQMAECARFAPFIGARKPVFNIEYPQGAGNGLSAQVAGDICSTRGKAASSDGFSKVIKKMNLDGWVEYCDGNKFSTQIEW